jgi:hypothetical protein
MSQALQNQPFAKLKPVTRCAASYVRENEALKEAFNSVDETLGMANNRINALEANWIELKEWMKGKKINFSGDDRFWRGYEDFYYDVKAKLKELEGGEG